MRRIWVLLMAAIVWAEVSGDLRAADAQQYAASGVEKVKAGKDQEALDDFNKAVELAPHEAVHYRNRAALYARLKDWNKAVEDYTKTLSLRKDPGVQFNRGYAYLQLNRLDDALRDLDAVLREQPGNERALR